MRKELLNQRPTSALRGQAPLCESVGTGHTSTHPSIFTKVLLVLLAMLLLPSTAWADYTYGGEALTFYRMNDSNPSYYYSGSEDNKTIEWNANTSAGYESSQSAYTSFTDLRFTYANSLTGLLNNITIVGNNTESALQDATIKVYKLTTPDATDETQRTQIGTISNEGATYTYTPTEGVQGFNNEYIQLAIVPTGDNQRFYTNQIKSITLTFSGTEYDLYVGDYHVTSYNASNVLGNGTVSYDADTKKLTLTNATLKKESVQEGVTIIIPTEISSNFESEQLTIDLVGTNKLYGFIRDDSSAGTLKFTGTGSLEITNHDGTISGYTDVDFGSFKLKSNSPGINYGEAGGVQDFHRLQDYTKDKPVTNVIITTETVYPIWVYDVAGDDNRHFLQLTYDNKDNVLGDGYSSVSYNGNGTLTIKGAQISSMDYPSFVIDKDISALTVHLVGYNQVGGAEKNAFQFLGTNTALQFTTSETLPGSLHYYGTLASGVSGDIDYKNGLEHNANGKEISATISNLDVSPFTGFVSVINDNFIYSNKTNWYASKAELNHVAPLYVTVSPRSGTSTSMWPTALSNPSYISKVLFQFDWGTCTNTNVTVQVKGLTTGGELDGETYSEPIALSTANADGIVDIELNKAVTSANLQLVFTSESDFSIVPLSVGFKETTYDLIVGETTVSMANKDDVLDNGTVSFTSATETTSAKLILNGASVPKITSGLAALTIEIKETSSVGYIETNTATEGDKTLTITKGSNESELDLSAPTGHSVIEGFKSVSVGEGLYVHSDNPCVYSTSNKRYETTDATPALLGTLTFTTTPYYPLWVTRMQSSDSNTYQVSDDNKTDILGTITSVQFDGTTNTLTFVENEDLYMHSCVYVTSGLDALTIAINGSCKLSSFNKGDTTPAITSVNPDAPLTIALAEGATSGDLALISVQGKAISGFKSLTHTGLLNLTDGASYSTENLQWSASKAAFATEIKKPTIEINYSDQNKYFSINNPNAGGYGGTLMLKTVKMTNKGKVEDDEEEIKDSYSQDYNYGIAIWKYWVKANDNVSDPIYVCRLGLEDIEVTYGDTSIPTPNILPENIDGVSLSYSTEDYEADVAEVVEGTITIKSTGRQPIDATFSNIPDDYTFLTDEENGTPEASFSLLVKPQEPTLSLESSTYVGTQTIEVGNISPNATAKYYTYEGENAPENPEVSVVPENHKIEIASSKTLVVYSETEYDLGDNSGTGYLTSETVSATYTILKDISLCTVTPEEATYTGEAIELVVKASETGATTTTLTEGTDYTVSYQKVTGETATDVESMIDAGTYKITITGKGNYGGTKEISVFQIAQASLADAAISKLIVGDKEYTSEVDKVIEIPYTGEAIQPEVVVIFNDGTVTVDASEYTVSYGENNTEISTTPLASVTVTSTGKNFEEGTFTSLNFKIVPAPVTITAAAQTVTYNAQQQAYTGASADNENVTLAIAYYPSEEERTTGSNALAGALTDAGTYYVSVTLNEESQQHYTAEPANVTFTIEQLNISEAVITLDNEELTYNGKEQSVTVEKVMVGDIEVAADYYEKSGNSRGTEAGNYTLIVTAKTVNSDGSHFKNNFKGSAEKAWKINHRTASAEELGFKSETQTASTYYNSDEDFNLPEGYVAYIITGINGNSVTTQRVSYIPKGVAVLVEKGQSSESPNDATPYPSTLPLKGTQEPVDVTSITGGTVYVLYNGEFVKSTSGTIPAHRCYLLIPDQIASGTRSFGIDHGDGTTALREVKGEKWADGEWYTLQGQRIAKPAKGLYILNGKKVVIK